MSPLRFRSALFHLNSKLWFCKGCKKQFTVKIGSIFEDSPLGMNKWMMAFWLIVNCKNGVSSCEIARDLGITQKSAWHMMHRIRRARQSGSFIKFSGEVKADETFIGGKARNMHVGARNGGLLKLALKTKRPSWESWSAAARFAPA